MYKQRFRILSFAYCIIFAIPTLLSQELSQENQLNKNAAEYSSFWEGYDAFTKRDYQLARRIFRNIIKDDVLANNYDVNPFLAATYLELGHEDSAKATYRDAITRLEDLSFFHPDEKKYNVILQQLQKWSADFPTFPQELLEENGFTLNEIPPEPKAGWESLEKHLKYPESLKKSSVAGGVTVQVLINEAGKPTKFEVVDSLHPEADAAAIDAIKSVRWTIPKTRGRVSSLWVKIPVIFQDSESSLDLDAMDHWVKNLEQWEGVQALLQQKGETDPHIGMAYIELVTRKKAKSCYAKASELYMWGFSGSVTAQNQSIVLDEAKRIIPLLDGDDAERWQKLIRDKNPQLSREIRLFWLQRDPQLTTPVNERLIEHWERIGHARETFQKNNNSIYGCDDRGTVYVKYGEPLRTQSGLLGTSTDSDIELLRISSPSVRAAIQRVNPPEYEVWIYGKLYGEEPAIFLFSRKNGRGSFGLRDGVEDVIDSGDLRYILQLMYYAELKWFARLYDERHRELEIVWDNAGVGSENRLHGYFFDHRRDDKDRLEKVAAERSDYSTKFPALNLAAFAVRLLGEDNESQLAIISKATLQRNLDKSDPGFRAIVSRPQQTLIIWDQSSAEVARLEGKMSEGSGYFSIFEVRHNADHLSYAIAAEARAVAPNSFLAVGNTFLPPNAPLDPDPDSLQLSDLMIGHDLGAKFAKSYRPRIPLMPGEVFNRQEPMRAYLEAYHLKLNEDGLGRLSIEFAVHMLDKKGRRAKNEGEISLTFDFDAQGTTSKQDHAIDLSKLEPGHYELSAKVRDAASSQEETRRKRFTLEK
jgi:TonB family protein